MINSRRDGLDAGQIRRHRALAKSVESPDDDRPVGLERQTVIAPSREGDDAAQSRRHHALAIRVVSPGDDCPVRLERQTVSPDRKSTRLNSSHSSISYAVFCLK